MAHFQPPIADSGDFRVPSSMFAQFFSTIEVDKLADTVVGELRRSLPASAASGNSKAALRARELSADKVQKCVDHFAAGARLNVYQKALLGTRLEAAMQAAGYEAGFSKSLAFDVVRALAVAMAGKRH